MNAAHTSPSPGGGTRFAGSRRWPIWREPRAAGVYVVTVILAACAFTLTYAVQTPLRPSQLLTWVALVVCGGICVEGARRLGEPQVVARDLVFAWGLPVALLLPPLYAFVFPIPIAVLTQLRVKRSPIYRRVFSTAARGLACGAASASFHAVLGGSAAMDAAVWLSQPQRVVSAAVAAGVLCIVVNELLVGAAIRLSVTNSRWRDAVWDIEAIKIDLVELSIGVLVAVAAVIAVPSVMLALPPVLLLQRSLIHEQLRTAARTDAKTGLLNAGTWQREAESEILRADRTGSSLALLLVDIDHFKRVNDQHGHLLGDDVLVAVAGLLGSHLRDYDLLGRFGGEEFVVLLPETDGAEASRVAERLRSNASVVGVPAGDGHVHITVSIGVALLRVHARNLTDLIAAADVALYNAKATGRDRVCMPGGDHATAADGHGATDGHPLPRREAGVARKTRGRMRR